MFNIKKNNWLFTVKKVFEEKNNYFLQFLYNAQYRFDFIKSCNIYALILKILNLTKELLLFF